MNFKSVQQFFVFLPGVAGEIPLLMADGERIKCYER